MFGVQHHHTLARRAKRTGAAGSAPYCSFCGKGSTRRRNVVHRYDGLYICDECVDRTIDALSRPGALADDGRVAS